MPSKRGGKRAQVARTKGSTVKTSAGAAAQTPAGAQTAATKPVNSDRAGSPASRAEAGTLAPETSVGVKRNEPESPAIDLEATLQRRQKLAEELQVIEKQIYDLETRYLENSHPLGNAIKGYEGLLTQSQASSRRLLVRQEDRLFSNSSASGAPH